MTSGAYPFDHPGPPPELPELPEGAPPPRHPPRRPAVTPWPAWSAVVAFIAGFGMAVAIASVALVAVAAISGHDLDDAPGGAVMLATLIQDVVLVATAVVLARVTSKARGPWHFGLRAPKGYWRAFGWFAAAYASFLIFTGLWLVLLKAFGVNVDQNDELPKELGANANTYALVAVGILVTVVAPMAEELFFRGYVFTALRNWCGVAIAALLTGALFGLVHVGSAPVQFLVPLGIFGVILCLLYWRTNSLFPCIVLHCVNNCVAFGVSQDYTWQIPLIVVGALTLIGAILLPLAGRGSGRYRIRRLMTRSRAALSLLAALVVTAIAAPAAHAGVTARTTGAYPFGINRAVFQGDRFAVTGTATGAGASNVIVRLYRGGKVSSTSRPKVGAKGAYKANFRIGRAGQVVVEVVRGAGGGAKATRAKKFTVNVLNPSSRVGPTMRFLQSRLLALHYWPTLSGRYDERTRWAIRAYRKVNGMPRTFALNREILNRVGRGVGTLKLRYGATGRDRVEANLGLQVYALIDAKGKIFHIVDTSSGRPAFPSDLGRFRFYSKVPGTLPDGMVNSVFYNGGEAVHGYPSVPNYPWSHGCLRTPITYSREIMNWLRIGDRIDVYGRAR